VKQKAVLNMHQSTNNSEYIFYSKSTKNIISLTAKNKF